MLPHAGEKHATGKTTIFLEDYKMSPGDLITLYATARDARTSVKTDMYFIEAQPYEKNYSQAQASDGGAGRGDQDESRISERQKEIIAATWNEIKNGVKDPATARDDSKFLSELEGTLSQQSKSLAERMRARNLSGANQEFSNFAKNMEEASEHMKAAVERIHGMKWNDAIAPEQQALQNLLRAEAIFRDIQVAFGSRGQGGQGGGMGRDLENLFDLELDTEKNQYETGQQQASASQKDKQVDEALQKLKELARRQQELAQQQQKQQQAFRQRWEQEMLRREAEELQRKMEQLQRGESAQQQQSNSQQSQQQANSQGSSSSQSSSQGQSQGQSQSQSQAQPQSQQSQSGASRGTSSAARQRIGQTADPRLQQALDRLKQATDDMRRAESSQNGNPEQGNAGQRRAADRLQEASSLLSGLRQDQAAGQLDEMTRQAERLAEQQKDYQNRLRGMLGNPPDNGMGRPQPGQNSQQMGAMAGEKEQMANDLKKLENQMQSSSRNMAGTQPSASSKLREALGEAQQNELDLRMRKAAELMRRGQGMYTWPGEPTVTNGLDRLRDQLHQAQGSLRPEDQQKGKPGGANGDDKLSQALDQLERTRQRMQEMSDAQRGNQQGGRQPGGQRQSGELQRGNQQQGQQQGQQPGGQQPGGQQPGGQQPGGQQANGQQPGQQQGQQQGQQGQGKPGGQQQGGQNGGAQGGDRQTGGEYGSGGLQHNGFVPDQVAREVQRDLSNLRSQLRDNPQLSGQVQDLMRQLQTMTTTYQNPQELSDRIGREILPEVERLELVLRRELGQSGSQVRNSASEPVPPGYADSVAEYFRKLSKGK